MLKYTSCLFVVFAVFISGLYAQDSIVLYNGKTILGKVNDDKNLTYISYELKKKHSVKTKYLHKENIFGVYYKDSVADIYYFPQPSEDINLTVEEMQSFISGENLARYRYHPRWASICGAATGVSMIWLGIYGLLIPTAYVGVVSATPVNPVKKKYFPEEKVNDEFFIEGFKQEGKRKKLVNAVIGSVTGAIIVGTTLGILTSQDYKNW